MMYNDASGDAAWSEFLLKSLGAVKKQFLAGYLCASLYYLIEDTCSCQILFADSEADTVIMSALLAAASSTEVLVSLPVESQCNTCRNVSQAY